MKDLKYEIVKSGSRGNCVIIDDMMFDCGVPYRDLEEHLYKIKYLFITHRHCDHVNSSTIRRIQRKYPRIRIIGNYDVIHLVKLDHMVGDGTSLSFADRKIQSFKCVHNVPCSGYVVKKGDITFIYATDTSTLEHAPKIKYDYFFIEGNHDEKKIEQIMGNQKKYGYNAWKGAMRHLSTQKSETFYYLNRRSKNSKWIELHKSERFY